MANPRTSFCLNNWRGVLCGWRIDTFFQQPLSGINLRVYKGVFFHVPAYLTIAIGRFFQPDGYHRIP
jgi:hypothetical protein